MLSCNLPEYSHPALFAHATHLLHILKQIFKKARCLVILSNCLYPLAGATIPSSKLTKKSSAIHHPLRATTIHCRGRSPHMKRIELAIQPPSGSVNMELIGAACPRPLKRLVGIIHRIISTSLCNARDPSDTNKMAPVRPLTRLSAPESKLRLWYEKVVRILKVESSP